MSVALKVIYPQTHQAVYNKYVRFFTNHTSIKWFLKNKHFLIRKKKTLGHISFSTNDPVWLAAKITLYFSSTKITSPDHRLGENQPSAHPGIKGNHQEASCYKIPFSGL